MPSPDIPSLVVTGATSGIGEAIARAALARGWRVFGSARRREDADRLAHRLGERFHPLVLDVTDYASLERAAGEVGAALGEGRLAGLVANAGIGIPGPLECQDWEEWRRQVEVNLFGTAATAKAFLPLLGTDPARRGGKGRIVTMSSLGGIVGQPFVTGYCASKHGIEGFSEALRRELAPLGIPVIIMAPSLVETPVWDKVRAQDLSRFDHTRWGRAFRSAIEGIVEAAPRHGMSVEGVAQATMRALTDRHPRLRYAPARVPLIEQGLIPLAPRRLIDAIMRFRMGRMMGE